MSVLIKNAIIVNADGESSKAQDILLDKGVISKIASSISGDHTKVIDAKGKKVLPGLIDIHVHFRDPGFEYKETIETGSRAAAKGGFTSVFCMPNTKPVTDNKQVVEYILNAAKKAGLCNVYPIGAITKGQSDQELTDMCELKEAGCLALSDDGKSVVNSRLMFLAMQYSKMTGVLLIEHCQDELITDGGVMNEGETSSLLGLNGDPDIAESIIVGRDIQISDYLGVPVHFCHISSKRSVDLIRDAKKRGVKVTAEACPHHFTLTDEAVKTFSTNAKMNPPLREQTDIDAIKKAIKDGTIDCIVTDHAPHNREEKEAGFDEAPFGIIGLESSLGLTMTELVHKGVISLPEMVDKMSTTPAKIVGLDQKGVIKEGLDADITIIDPDKEWEFSEEDIASKSKNTPFLGYKLKGRVTHTICGGRLVYEDK